jgi:hypothetical protein
MAAFPERGSDVSLLLWIALSTLYLVLLWTIGITTFRKGHLVLFLVGIVFPIAWVVGALLRPAPAVREAEARSSVQ